MKKILLLAVMLTGSVVFADLLNNGSYVRPESYTVNEADMIYDYSHIPAPPKLNVDNLDDMRFNAPDLVEKEIQIGSDKSKKDKKAKKEKIGEDEAYKKRLSYKFAKWWVDQRYKREEAHHGDLHEIKVNKRIENEKKLEEK